MTSGCPKDIGSDAVESIRPEFRSGAASTTPDETVTAAYAPVPTCRVTKGLSNEV